MPQTGGEQSGAVPVGKEETTGNCMLLQIETNRFDSLLSAAMQHKFV